MKRVSVRASSVALITALLAMPVLYLSRNSIGPREPASAQGQSIAQQEPAIPPRPLLCANFHKAICGSKDVARDPSGLVKPDREGELEARQLHETILKEHPEWSEDEVREALARTIYTEKRRKRIQSAFRWARQTIEDYITHQRRSVFTREEKQLLIARLKSVDLQLPAPAAVYADEPDLLTKNDVIYERMTTGALRLRVGGAYLLTAKSWFNMIFTLAHELGHSIDPCEMAAQGIHLGAYERLTSCFARNGLISDPGNWLARCSSNEHLSETFSDWLAVRVTGEALKAFATEFHGPQLIAAAKNAVRDLCEQDEVGEVDLTFHPAPEVRIEKIFGQDPVIRGVLGCAPPKARSTCRLESPSWRVNSRK